MFTNFIDLSLHLDSVTVVVGEAGVVFRIIVGYLHFTFPLFV